MERAFTWPHEGLNDRPGGPRAARSTGTSPSDGPSLASTASRSPTFTTIVLRNPVPRLGLAPVPPVLVVVIGEHAARVHPFYRAFPRPAEIILADLLLAEKEICKRQVDSLDRLSPHLLRRQAWVVDLELGRARRARHPGRVVRFGIAPLIGFVISPLEEVPSLCSLPHVVAQRSPVLQFA